MAPSFKYLLILFSTFGVSHFFFSLLEKAEYLPPWLNPVRAALLVTFVVQLWMLIKFSQSAMPVEP
jgi:hypothetical protein